MKLQILAVLFSLSFNSRGDSSPDYGTFGKNVREEFLDKKIKDPKTLTQDESAGFTKADSFEMFFPFFKQIQEKYYEKNEDKVREPVDDPLNSDISNEDFDFNFPTLNERILNGHLARHFLKIYQKHYRDNEENFQNEETTSGQELARRQINNWKVSDEFFDPSNIAENLNTFYPRINFPYSQNDYLEEPSYSSDLYQYNESFVGPPESLTNPSYQVEHPQYYQKNYYYNYYPLINDQKNIAPKWNGDKIHNSEEVIKKEKFRGRKLKNPCKQYLQFLRYAFKELDENPDYHYDYNEEYSDDWGEIEAKKSYGAFSTQMRGPTLYIDNSGKVSQINSKESSVQMIAGVSPASKVSAVTIQTKLTSPATFPQDLESRTEVPTSFSNPDYDNSFVPDYHFEKTENTKGDHTKKPYSQILNSDLTKPRISPLWTPLMREYPTTMITDMNERTTADDYGENNDTTSITTSSPNRYALGDYYVTVENSMEGAMADANLGKSNASAGSPLYWYTRSSTSVPFISPKVNHFKAKTVVTFEDSTELNRKDDCNDKMLPCPDTVNITYPLNGYCNRYVSCESGRAIRRTCPDGLHFNIITKSCDFPHNSFCTYFCPESNGHYGIPGDCSGYFTCKNFVPEYRMCPPKMHWDLTKSICTFAELSSCPMKCSNVNEVKHYNGDCKAYIICLNGFPYYHKCPLNTKFDSHTHSCVPDHQSTCQDDPRLLTKNLNPNSLCRDVEMKLGTKVWCSYFLPTGYGKP